MAKYVALLTIVPIDKVPEEAGGSEVIRMPNVYDIPKTLINMSKEQIAKFAQKGKCFKIEL